MHAARSTLHDVTKFARSSLILLAEVFHINTLIYDVQIAIKSRLFYKNHCFFHNYA